MLLTIVMLLNIEINLSFYDLFLKKETKQDLSALHLINIDFGIYRPPLILEYITL